MNQRILNIVKKHPKVLNFILHTEKEVEKYGVKIDLRYSNKVMANGLRCSGFFDSTSKTFVCGVKKPLSVWLPIYVHEYCHFLQWRDGSVYFDPRYPRYCESTVDDWLAGNSFSKTKIFNSIEASKECELDCEKRVVKLIKKFNLPMDVDNYIKRANVYVMFYNYVMIRRKWVPKGKPMPYNIKKLRELFPPRFLKSYESIPMKYLQELDKEYGTESKILIKKKK